MRKITETIALAFFAHKAKTINGNGATSTDGEAIFLHGNKIVERRGSEIWVTLAGWNTLTTRERLKPFANVNIEKGQPFLDSEAWDGDWAKVGGER